MHTEPLNQLNTISEKELKRDTYQGCLLGGAIGDALGAPIEFLSHAEIVEKYGSGGVQSYVEHPDEKGEFTANTQMLLFTAEGLLRAWHRAVLRGLGGAEITITHQSYLRWLQTQGYENNDATIEHRYGNGWLIERTELHKKRSPDNVCLTSLQSGRWGTVKNPINNNKESASVVRIVPVGFVYNNDRERAFNAGVELSATTHGHPSAYLSAGLLSSIIADISNGLDLEKAILNGLEILKTWQDNEELYQKIQLASEIHQTYIKGDITNVEIELLGQGFFAEEALAMSLLCALHYRDDFQKAITVAVNHSGDSDSVGSITGSIVGLMVGQNKIPDALKQNLLYKDIVETVGLDLSIGCKSYTDKLDEDWQLKYPGY